MSKTILKNKFWVIIVLCLTLAFSYSNAFAWGDGHHGGEWWHHGGERYHYRGDRWYGRGWFGLEFAVTALAIGAIVESLPPRHTTVVVAGTPYYYCDGAYFRPYPTGYVVVPAPVVIQPVVISPAPAVTIPAAVIAASPVAQPQVSGEEVVTINVPNSNGGYTPVTLVKHNNGYIGPQGEYYEGHPTVAQLRALYGN